MLTAEESTLARSLSAIYNMPIKFVELVIECEPLDMATSSKLIVYKERVQFVDDVLSVDVPMTDEMEFHAQSLSLDKDCPIEMARLIVKAEARRPIEEENQTAVRADRLDFFYKICSFLQNHSRFM